MPGRSWRSGESLIRRRGWPNHGGLGEGRANGSRIALRVEGNRIARGRSTSTGNNRARIVGEGAGSRWGRGHGVRFRVRVAGVGTFGPDGAHGARRAVGGLNLTRRGLWLA